VLARTLGTAITVCARVPHGIPPLLADRAQLETALINLGANARDAMPEGGRLVLAAEAEQVAAGAHHPAGLAPGDYVRLSVADTGTGMDAPMVASVTEPFFTTKPAGQGTGLGLTMAKVFAEQSGGGLSIASAPGQGTTVAIWLRQATCSPRQAGERERRAPGQGGAARRILVVDDDDLVRETVAAQLEVEGFATLVASSGIEALALIEAGEVVDALVSDLTMPGMNGMAVIRQARALRPGLPCFLLTGDIGACAASSAVASWTLVRKPIAGPALAAQIMATLSGASR
jgi:CheY-like chemotaxis protein